MIKLRAYVSLLLLALPVTAAASLFEDSATPCVNATGTTYEAAFSPGGEVSPLIVKTIATAQKSIRVAGHDFTSKPVSEALVQAARAGRDLKVVLDKKTNGHNGYSNATFLRTMSYPPHLMKQGSVYLNYIVIDEKDIIVGNIAGLPDADEEKKNAVGVLIIHNAPELAKRYLANWQKLWDASEEIERARTQHDPL